MNKQQLARRIVALAELGDNRALATDGPVPPTHDCLDRKQIVEYFRTAYCLAQMTLGKKP